MVRRPMVGADNDPPLTAPKRSGTAGMKQIVPIGIGAGAAAALLFASLGSGSPFAFVLFYLSPLPILIAGIGWSYVAGLIAAVFATACLGLLRDGYLALAFAVTIALPAWWLGYLALLARPADGVSPDKLEWYPAGRIVLWAALIGAAVVVIAIPFFGTDAQSFQDTVKAGIESALRGHTDGELNQDSLYLLVKLAPGLVAWLTAMVLLIN